MDAETIKILKRVSIDLLCLIAVGLPILIFFLFGEPYKRGFFCNDESIKYPYKESTVSNIILYIVGLGVPVIIMLLVEFVHYWRGDEFGRTYKAFGKTIPLWVSNSYKVIGIFGFGAACSQFLTDIGKYSVGRLRPHFIDVCSPNVSCDLPQNRFKYIETFTCNGGDDKLLRDARLSFPSGHSSFAGYTMLYLVIYLQCRLNWKGSYLLRHVVQFCCIGMMWGTALSRVSNYKHHWSDVTVGLIIGIVVAIVNAVCVSDLFKKQRRMINGFKGNAVLLSDGTDLTTATQPLTEKPNTSSVSV